MGPNELENLTLLVEIAHVFILRTQIFFDFQGSYLEYVIYFWYTQKKHVHKNHCSE